MQTKKTQIVTTRTRKKMSHNSNQTNALSVVLPLKTKKVLKSTAPPNIDENKMLPHPLDSGLVTQTHETCKKGLFHSTITSSKNGKKHKIQQSLNCKSKNICYLINCKHCNQQYTGETKREFHLRLNSHTSDIKLNQRSTGMVRHFSECGSENIQPIILEKYTPQIRLYVKPENNFISTY